MAVINENGRTLAGVIAELKDELKDFIQTRLDMMRAEMRDKVKSWKVAVPLIGVALVLLATGWLVVTACLVSLIAVAFLPSPYAYFFATLIVSVVYLVGGGACAAFGVRELKQQGVAPERTLKILKDDRVWLQTESTRKVA